MMDKGSNTELSDSKQATLEILYTWAGGGDAACSVIWEAYGWALETGGNMAQTLQWRQAAQCFRKPDSEEFAVLSEIGD